MDLEAELARFEAEIAAVDQQTSQQEQQHVAPPPSKLPPPKMPPPKMPPPTLPPPTLPPPTLPPPTAPPPRQQQQQPMPAQAPPTFPSQSIMNQPPHFHPPQQQQQQQFYQQDMYGGGMNPNMAMAMNMGMGMGGMGMGMGGMYGMDPSMAMASTSAAAAAPPQLTVAQIKAQESGKAGTAEEEKEKKKGVLREAAGKRWRDPTLDEWPENDFRIFVGDMGNEVTDDSLAKAFNKYPSFAKAKIVRDQRTKKSKGFGFVSFTDGNDFAKAMREMQGKYIGNRPCKLTKSSWDDRTPQFVKKGKGGGGGGGKKQKF